MYLVTALVPSDTAGLASLPRKEPGLVQWLRLNNSREKYLFNLISVVRWCVGGCALEFNLNAGKVEISHGTLSRSSDWQCGADTDNWHQVRIFQTTIPLGYLWQIMLKVKGIEYKIIDIRILCRKCYRQDFMTFSREHQTSYKRLKQTTGISWGAFGLQKQG